MQKLALNLDDLDVQSFDTTCDARELRCTVRGYMDDDNGGDGGGDYSDLCSAVYSCATCVSCDAVCDAEEQRRIILYGS
ncbi:MAG TPA: hypothetical protein VEQ60_24315 [Longimicrobium sp.]|nr:hypothetical protein [Longimicrobium sp.]